MGLFETGQQKNQFFVGLLPFSSTWKLLADGKMNKIIQ